MKFLRFFPVLGGLTCLVLFALPVAAANFNFTRDLKMGSTGEDVLALQKMLNESGFAVSKIGAGSPGNETDYFGGRTRDALSAYQKANGIFPTAGYFGRITRASITTPSVSSPSPTSGQAVVLNPIVVTTPIVSQPTVSSVAPVSCSLPKVTTSLTANIGTNRAVSGGNVSDAGGCSLTERGVVYGEKENPTISDNKIASGSGIGYFTSSITGLSSPRSYHVRAYAQNAKGITYGEEKIFTTTDAGFSPMTAVSGCSIPSLSTASASSILGKSAVSGGIISNSGGCDVTERGFVWSASENPTVSDTKVTSGSGNGSFTGNMIGLSSASTYHTRAYAVNQKGTAYGSDASVTTDRIFLNVHGGNDWEYFSNIINTSDGGYVVTGNTQSTDGEFPHAHLRTDMLIAKFNNAGTLQWYKAYGGDGDEAAYSAEQTADGGYIVVGSSDSNEGEFTGQIGGHDIIILKLDSTGNITWQKRYGGTDSDVLYSIIQTADGGYFGVGDSLSVDGNIPGNYGAGASEDMIAVKLSSNGNIQWIKNYGTDEYDSAYAIAEETSDGGFVFGGEADGASDDFPVSYDAGIVPDEIGDWGILKVDSDGDVVWTNHYGGPQWDSLRSMVAISGGYVAFGMAGVTGNDILTNNGDKDFAVLKINSSGVKQWFKTYGGTDYDEFDAGIATSDGGYAVVGRSYSNDLDVGENNGSDDGVLFKLDSSGDVSWHDVIGGSRMDNFNGLVQATDGGYMIAGQSESSDGDVLVHYGAIDTSDALLVKTDDNGNWN